MFETTVRWVKGIEPYSVGMMARPRGGEPLQEEVAACKHASIGLVVSLPEAHEIRELELKAEPTFCAEQGIEFRHFPIPDRGVPSSAKGALALVEELHVKLIQGTAVAVHCRAGIGRTGLVVACLLHKLGMPRTEIIDLLSRSFAPPIVGAHP